MFTLYKKRTFGDFVSDTFIFFKTHGKHFFKHYFIINGSLLLIMMVLSYFIFKVYFEVLFSNLNNQDPGVLESFYTNNVALIVGVVIFFILLMVLLFILGQSFPVFYLKLLDKHSGTNFTSKTIINEIKQNFTKLLKYALGLIFLSIFLGGLLLIVFFALIFIIIGIPLMLIIFPFIVAFVNLTLYNYLTDELTFFSACNEAIGCIRRKFWAIIGATLVVYIIFYIATSVFTLIPYIFGFVSLMTDINENINSADRFNTIGIMMTLIFCISILASLVLGNLILINSGIIYYSDKENEFHISTKSNIDLIGTKDE